MRVIDITASLDRDGYAVLPGVLSQPECVQLLGCFDDPWRFRKTVVMEHHGFGHGIYKYFTYPLPETVATLRGTYYELLAPLANDWSAKLGLGNSYPAELGEFLEECRANGQSKPTPLVLRYQTGDFNRLHQDIYGDTAFPYQLAVCLSQPDVDFSGGEFVLTEQRPRIQTKADVVRLDQGDAIVFSNQYRPVKSARGYSRATIRHGVSMIRRGVRYCLGIIFHDAS